MIIRPLALYFYINTKYIFLKSGLKPMDWIGLDWLNQILFPQFIVLPGFLKLSLINELNTAVFSGIPLAMPGL